MVEEGAAAAAVVELRLLQAAVVEVGAGLRLPLVRSARWRLLRRLRNPLAPVVSAMRTAASTRPISNA